MSHVFYRDCQRPPVTAVRGDGCYIVDSNGKRYLDACGGAAVSNFGHNHPQIIEAIKQQFDQLPYAHTGFFSSEPAEQLADILANQAPIHNGRVYFTAGGSEAMECALKMAYQYHCERGQPSKRLFITRRQSYHGNTLGALAVGGHEGRKRTFMPILNDSHHVSPCYEYRHKKAHESAEDYASRLAAELDEKIVALGAENVGAFIAETVGGATAGVLPPSPTYFKKIRAVCDRHNVLLILDEVMCGIMRSGSFYACEKDDVVPDMVAVAKGLSAGYMPLGALVVQPHVHQAFVDGSGTFQHGHTFMAHPSACAAALAVCRLLAQGDVHQHIHDLSACVFNGLRSGLADMPWVGDIRGRGLFIGVELVADRATKAPLPRALQVHARVKQVAMERGLMCYPAAGTADGVEGHHILIAPAFIMALTQVDELVTKLRATLDEVQGIVGV